MTVVPGFSVGAAVVDTAAATSTEASDSIREESIGGVTIMRDRQRYLGWKELIMMRYCREIMRRRQRREGAMEEVISIYTYLRWCQPLFSIF
jgi:hypothetical protein